MLKRILVALSGTPYTPVAVEHAVELAKAHQAEVTGVTVTDLRRLANVGPIPVGGSAAAHELAEHRIQVTEERITEAIHAFETACREAQVPCHVSHETGTPLEELRSLCRYHDLTIFGLRGLFEYGVVHNPDDLLVDVIRHGVRPILAVARKHRAVKRVYIAYSGSMESGKAMKRFVQSRLWPDVTAKVACFDRKPKLADELLKGAQAYCHAHGLEVETEAVDEKARDNLLDYAEAWNADLIVMGSTNRMRILKHVIGNTVLEAIRHSEVPLYLTQ